jgi:hypothetical protein
VVKKPFPLCRKENGLHGGKTKSVSGYRCIMKLILFTHVFQSVLLVHEFQLTLKVKYLEIDAFPISK